MRLRKLFTSLPRGPPTTRQVPMPDAARGRTLRGAASGRADSIRTSPRTTTTGSAGVTVSPNVPAPPKTTAWAPIVADSVPSQERYSMRTFD